MKMTRSRMIALGVGVVFVVSIGTWLGNRGEKESTGSVATGPSAATHPAGGDDSSAAVAVVQVVERNTDTFPNLLFEWTPESASAPFTIDEQGLHLLDSIANETDPAKLQAHRLVLGTAGVPLAKCGALVIYSTTYLGKGRAADAQRFYAYEKLPATIDIPAGFVGDKLEYDLEKAKQAFPLAVMDVRLVPKDATVKVAAAGGDKITVACAGTSKTLGAGEAARLLETKSAVAVTEVPVKSEPIGGGAAVEFFPRVEHGVIQFGTELSIQYVGRLRMAGKTPQVEGDLP